MTLSWLQIDSLTKSIASEAPEEGNLLLVRTSLVGLLGGRCLKLCHVIVPYLQQRHMDYNSWRLRELVRQGG